MEVVVYHFPTHPHPVERAYTPGNSTANKEIFSMRILVGILSILLIVLILQDAFETIVLPRRVYAQIALNAHLLYRDVAPLVEYRAQDAFVQPA